MSILLYGCTTWTLFSFFANDSHICPSNFDRLLYSIYEFNIWKSASILLANQVFFLKYAEKKFDSNYTRMLQAILNKSWRQHPKKQQLHGLLPPITKTIKIRRTRHAGHSWRSRDELISDVLLWIPSHGWTKAGRPARTYIQQLCAGTGCSSEDLPEAMDDREGWRERVKDIRADNATWWWWLTQNTHEITSFVNYFNKSKLSGRKCQIIYLYRINIPLRIGSRILNKIERNSKLFEAK